MAYKRKTWQEKMVDKPNLPKILKLEKRFPCYRSLEKMGVKVGEPVVLTNPREVKAIMNKVPKGKLITIIQICKKLARKYKVSGCCTLTTGIFIMIAANAAEETTSALPYWRTLKADGVLNEKYPGGVLEQKRRLEKEGFKVVKKGEKYFVQNFENKLLE